jgi:outer membrane protein insertion porin family
LIKTKSKYYFFLFLVVLQTGCINTRHLKENERILYYQNTTATKGINVDDLKDLYAQEANRKILGTPVSLLVGVHYFGKSFYKKEKYTKKITKAEKKFDKKIARTKSERKKTNLQFRLQTKIAKFNDRIENGNQLMQWGEPIAVFDTTAMNTTLERYKAYLFSKGYFHNSVQTKFTAIRRFVYVRYKVTGGKPYKLDSISYQANDSTIMQLLTRHKKNSFLKRGENYDQDKFTQERERIDLLMKDNGYFDFSRQYIEYNIDTTFKNHKVAVQVIINDPEKRASHKKFYLTEINFTPDAGVESDNPVRQTVTYKNINFHYFDNHYSTKVLSQRVFFQPNTPYNRQRTFDTQRQIANLNVFKFVNIVYDTTGGNFKANIFTSPLDRYQWSNEIGLSVTQGLPGPFYNINFLKRNIFRGFENFEMNGRIGYEGVAAATSTGNVYQSTEAGINASITFPQFLLPLPVETRYKLARTNPRTRIQIGYTYTDRPEYQRAATSLNYTYSWENQRIRRYDLTVANLGIINSSTSDAFQDFLQTQYTDLGNTLIFSFNSSFVSSIIFAMTWNHNSYGSRDKNSAFVRWAVESGGTVQNFVDIPIVKQNNLQTFKYLRASADIRRLSILNKTMTLAYRLNAGVAYSYDSRDVLPYEKYFFVGGSNSVRAWRPRRLGQGSFRPNISGDVEQNGYFDYRFEKPGDIAIEASVELRKKLIGFVEGAIFVDIGNVWTFKPLLKRDSEQNLIENGNSKFKPDQFYKEFGIGTGTGFRFNFSFLILRFDVGLKVYDPARKENDRFVLDHVRLRKPYSINREPIIYNIGIGYPF